MSYINIKHSKVFQVSALLAQVINVFFPVIFYSSIPVYAEEVNESSQSESIVVEEDVNENTTNEEEMSADETPTEDETTLEEESTLEESTTQEPNNVEEEVSEEGTEETSDETTVEETEPSTETEIVVEESSSEEIVEEETSNTYKENGMRCLTDVSFEDSSDDSWEKVNDSTYETKGNVELGVRYVFPGNADVSVAFSCLPENSEDISKLKIEQINVDDMDLPEGYVPAFDYAYDITTDMEDGTFNYEVTLPTTEDEVEVAYIEKSAEEVVSVELENEDLQFVNGDDVEKQDGKVKAKDQDHFTVYIIVTPDTHVPEVPWPDGNTGWTNYLDADGHVVNDYEDDAFTINDDSNGGTNVSPESIDIASGAPVSGQNAGNESSLQYYYDEGDTGECTDDYLFLRMRLVGDPSVKGNSGALYDSYHWDFLINTDSDSYSDYVVDIFGNKANPPISGGDSGTVGVYPNDANSYTYTPANYTWVAQADANLNYFTRLEKEDYNDSDKDNDQYWLEAAVPVSAFGGSLCGVTNLDGNIFASTSASNTNPLQKDWMNPTGFFTDHELSKAVENLTNPGATTLENPAKAGDVLVYTLTATNTGTLTIPGFVMEDDISDILEYADLTNANYDGNSRTGVTASGVISWDPINIATNSTLTEKFSVTVKASNEWPGDGDFLLENVYGNSTTVYIQKYGVVTACKFADTDLDGVWDAGESGLSGWGMTLNGDTQFTGEDGCTSFTQVTAGDYTVSEVTQTGWTNTTPVSQNITVNPNETTTVNFGNYEVPTVTLTKVVSNNYGGTAVVSNFTLLLGGNSVTSGTTHNVTPGVDITIDEAYTVPGYEFVSITGAGCPIDLGGTVNLSAGEHLSCTITNQDIQPTLTVNKVIVDDNGGSSQISDFTLRVDGSIVTHGVVNGYNAGTYTVSEDSDSGYTTTYGGDCALDGTVTLAVGENKVCTVTNNDNSATLTVIKIVDNTNGGSLNPSDFTMQVTGTNVSDSEFPGDDSGTQVTLDAGAYSVAEVLETGYTPVYSDDCSGTIANGESKVCTVTNSDVAPKLTLIKNVTNDDGGLLNPSDFTLYVQETGKDAIPLSSGETLTLKSNVEYTVYEDNKDGYTASAWSGACSSDGKITLAPGDDLTCEITNDDVAPTITLTKAVNRNYGGTAGENDFGLKIDDLVVTSGTTHEVLANTDVAINENGLFGYQFVSITGDPVCPSVLGGTVNLLPGQDISCTITNTDLPGTLIVKKSVVNDNGGTLNEDDFSFVVNGGNAVDFEADGENEIPVAAGTYTVTEPSVTGYTTTYNNCEDVVVTNGGVETCTITNDDQQGTLIVKKVVIKNDGGTLNADDFSFIVDSGNAVAFEEDGQNELSVASGLYTITEPTVDGYSATYDNCTNVFVPNGGSATCTITNDDQEATLIVKKVVNNDYGGTLGAAAFSFSVNSGDAVSFEEDGQNDVAVPAGTYTVVETAADGYTTTYNNCTDVVIPNGGSATCTITNNDIQPKLKVTKIVDGGNAEVSDFTLKVGATTVVSGVSTGFNVGDYVVTEETNEFGYTGSFSGACDANGNVSLALGDEKECILTNTRDTASLTVNKLVDTDADGVFETTNDGANTLGFRWSIEDDATEYEMGAQKTAIETGNYDVTEKDVTNYHFVGWFTGEGSCSQPNETYPVNIDLAKDENKVVTLCNAADTATVQVVKDVVPNDETLWDIEVTSNGGTEFGDVLGDGEATDETIVVIGYEYTITEKAPFGTDFGDDYTTTYSCRNGDTRETVSGDGREFNLDIAEGDAWVCTFTNTIKNGSISGYKYHDVNADSPSTTTDDVAVSGWGLFIDVDLNGVFDGGEPSTTTNINGAYTFTDLLPGTYRVYEVADSNWTVIYPTTRYFDVTVNPDENVTDVNFYNFRNITISGYKYNDTNGNGVADEGENTLSNWTINLSGEVSDSTVTDLDGYYEFTNLGPGEYSVEEVLLDGWKQTLAPTNPMSAVGGQDIEDANFANAPLTDVHGYKWSDENENGERDEGEDLLSGWRIFIDEGSEPNGQFDEGEQFMLTSDTEEDFGWYWFNDLEPGTYTICEELQPYWVQTYPVDPSCHVIELPFNGEFNFTQNAVFAPEFNFGNMQEIPTLEISKSNNRSGQDLHTGDNVTYTITVENLEVPAYNVKVTDLLPEGFKYRSGSWSATSSISGALALGEPTYASPGTWSLGDMQPGEIITLTYLADIQNSIDDGLYRDLAWALAEPGATLASATTTGFVDDNFVGTEVNVVSDPESPDTKVEVDEEVIEEGEVLGASTSLPATGASSIWLFSFIALLGLGLSMIVSGYMLKKGKKRFVRVFVIGFALAIFFAVGSKAHAAESYVRVEDPDSQVSDEFDITFVALDTQNRTIEAKCFVKKPSSGSFVQFDSTKNLQAGGDSENCRVSDSVLTQDGEYEFRVDATPSGGSTTSSQIVKTSYDSEGPDKPKYLEKTKSGSCKFELDFKTADDDETYYVEIYRGGDNKFDADSGSKIAKIFVGPDEKKEYDDDLYGSDCGKTFYYAIRAFDDAGNGSDVVAEDDTIIVKKVDLGTEDEGTTILEGEEGNVDEGGVSGDVEVTLGDGEDGSVLGEGDETSASGDGSEATESTEETVVESSKWWLLLVAFGIVLYLVKRAKKV